MDGTITLRKNSLESAILEAVFTLSRWDDFRRVIVYNVHDTAEFEPWKEFKKVCEGKDYWYHYPEMSYNDNPYLCNSRPTKRAYVEFAYKLQELVCDGHEIVISDDPDDSEASCVNMWRGEEDDYIAFDAPSEAAVLRGNPLGGALTGLSEYNIHGIEVEGGEEFPDVSAMLINRWRSFNVKPEHPGWDRTAYGAPEVGSAVHNPLGVAGLVRGYGKTGDMWVLHRRAHAHYPGEITFDDSLMEGKFFKELKPEMQVELKAFATLVCKGVISKETHTMHSYSANPFVLVTSDDIKAHLTKSFVG